MATVNISCDQNEDKSVTITDANAETGNHLFQFFTDGINVFNIASKSLSGDAVDAVTVTEDTSYGFTITAAQALLLNGSASNYKHYIIDGGNATLKNDGTVTVTPLSGSELASLKPYINGNNVIRTAVTRTLTVNDDTVIFENDSEGPDCNLPKAFEMPGKFFKIKNTGTADVKIKNYGNSTIHTLTTGKSCGIIAVGNKLFPSNPNDWEILFNN